MVCPLLGLSDELQLMIVELVVAQDHGREDLVSLSSTCSTYRLLLAPIIFDRVTLLNDAESAASAIALANSHHGQYVKQLRFEGSLNRDGYRRVIEQHTEGLDINKLRTIVQEAREKLFPESVYRVLSDLQHWFSKLDILTIRIEEQNAAWYESSPLPVGVRDLFDHPDLFKATIKRRKIHNWGQLQAKTYEALCENQNHNIKTLQILDLSRECDALDDPKFHKFLERIRTVGISHVLACRKRHGSAHYFETTRYLSRRFIDHLPSVQHLKLKGPVYGAWSYEGLPYDWTKEATLPLKVTQMPQLKSINLSQLLCLHADAADGLWTNTWGRMFKALMNSGATALRTLDIEPIHCSHCLDGMESHPRGDELLNPRAFAYGRTDDRHGYLELEVVARESDQIWYPALEELIRANRARGKYLGKA